jgi:peptide/nickel transport system substrate-binding protein
MEDLFAPLTDRSFSRRQFMRHAAALGLAAPVLGSLLAACGGDDDDDDDDGDTDEQAGGDPTATTDISVDVSGAATATAEAEAAGEDEPTEAEEEEAEEPTATTSSGSEGTSGGAIEVLREGDADLYDPVLNDSNNVIWMIYSVYQGLVKTDVTATGIEPNLAESWEISDDGLTYTFALRSGVKFSDGSDMTVDDVIWSLERARDTEESPWSFTLVNASEISAPDDSTIVIVLTEGQAAFLAALAMFNSTIVSQAWVEENGEEALAGMSMGTGPFAITEWRTSEYTLLTRNEHYWEEGLPYLDEVKVTTVPDSNAMILRVQAGEVDGVVGQLAIPFNRVADLQGDSNLQVLISPAAYNYFARVNVAYPEPNPPFDDPHVRLAMAYAIDYDTLIETVQFGIAEPSNSILPRGALYWNPDNVSPTFDLDKANEELAASTVPDGFEAEVLVVSGNAQQEAIAVALQAMWAEINCELIITPVDNAVAVERTNAGEYDVRLGGWTNDMIDPDQILSYFVLPESSSNARTGYLNQESADLVLAAKVELDPDAREEMYYEVQRIWAEDGPLFYLFNIPYIDVLQNHVKGYFHHPLGPHGFVTTYIEE